MRSAIAIIPVGLLAFCWAILGIMAWALRIGSDWAMVWIERLMLWAQK